MYDLSDEELDQAIERAVERNMIVYDQDTRANISKKLIYLMCDIMDGEEEKMKTLLVPSDVYIEFDPLKFCLENGEDYYHMYGVDIIRDKRLNQEGVKKFIEKYSITFPPDKESLVLGFGEDQVLLGAV